MPSVSLVVGGLAIDVIGALVITLPDIPRARLILRAERMRKGMRRMESNGIPRQFVGYEELQSVLEELYRVDFPDAVWAMRVGFHTVSAFGFEAIYLFVNPHDQDETITLGKDLGADIDYREARAMIQGRIDKQVTRVRVLGFALLAGGFLMQILGQFV